MTTATLSRPELFELVWTQSILSLTKRFAVTHQQLQKVCLEMSIPLPRQGHWDRIKAGHVIPRPVLTENYNGIREITLPLRIEAAASANNLKAIKSEQSGQVKRESAHNRQPDKLIVAAKKTLQERAKEYRGDRLLWTGPGELDMKVS